MSLTSVELYVQATVAVLVIVNPVDPVKIVIFNEVVTRQQLDRRKAALRVALLAGERGGDVARQQLLQGEDDHRGEDQGRDRQGEATRQEPQHQLSFSPVKRTSPSG